MSQDPNLSGKSYSSLSFQMTSFFLFLQIKTVIKVMNNFYGFGLCFIRRLISLPHGSALTMVIITRVSDVLSLCFISPSPFLSLCLPHFIDHIIKDVTYDCEKNSSRKRRKRTIRKRISIHLMQEGRSWKMLKQTKTNQNELLLIKLIKLQTPHLCQY